jgi:hypothetical protein
MVGPRFGAAELRGVADLAGLFAGDEPEPRDEDDEEEDDDDEFVAFGALTALHGWMGAAGPGVALAIPVRTEIDPGIAGIELRVREDGSYLRSALPSLRDRHGDLTIALPLPPLGDPLLDPRADDVRLLRAFLPYAALPRRVRAGLVLEAWLVEDGDPVEDRLWRLAVPPLADRLAENALGAVAVAAISAAAVGGKGGAAHALADAARSGRIEAALGDLFTLDPTGRAVAAELLRAAEPEAVGAVAARLRAWVAPEALGRVLGVLHDLGPGGGVLPPLEAAFLAALAGRLGVAGGPKAHASSGGGRSRRPASGRGASPAMQAHLRVLDLAAGASWEEVRTAYRRAATVHHPDRAQALSPAEQAVAHERMKRINAAYAALRRVLARE